MSRGFIGEERGQGSLEYLILLAGVILFVAIIGFYLKTLAGKRLANEAREGVEGTAVGF